MTSPTFYDTHAGEEINFVKYNLCLVQLEKIEGNVPKRYDGTFKALISEKRSRHVCLNTNTNKIFTFKTSIFEKHFHGCLKTKIGKIRSVNERKVNYLLLSHYNKLGYAFGV